MNRTFVLSLIVVIAILTGCATSSELNPTWMIGKEVTYLADSSVFSYSDYTFKTGIVMDTQQGFVLINSNWINIDFVYSVSNTSGESHE